MHFYICLVAMHDQTYVVGGSGTLYGPSALCTVVIFHARITEKVGLTLLHRAHFMHSQKCLHSEEYIDDDPKK